MSKRQFTEQERKNQNNPKYQERKYRYRREDPEYRRQARQKYYDKTKVVTEKTKTRPTGVPHRPWNEFESMMILMRSLDYYGAILPATDREIGKAFNRSVHAIQQKRLMLKKEMK